MRASIFQPAKGGREIIFSLIGDHSMKIPSSISGIGSCYECHTPRCKITSSRHQGNKKKEEYFHYPDPFEKKLLSIFAYTTGTCAVLRHYTAWKGEALKVQYSCPLTVQAALSEYKIQRCRREANRSIRTTARVGQSGLIFSHGRYWHGRCIRLRQTPQAVEKQTKVFSDKGKTGVIR